MKILLIAGHGSGDSGALGNDYRECDLTRELVNLIAPKLKSYATVEVYDQKRNAFTDVQKGMFDVKKNEFDYALEIHFNAYSNPSAHGTEMYVTTSEKGISVEQAIMKNMKRYFTLRDNDSIFDGVKRTNFLVIKTLKGLGISGALLETCFITNANDMKVYQDNKNGIAEDIVAGIVSGFGLKKKTVAKPKAKTIAVGSKVKIKNGAKYGGLASTRGRAVPLAVRNKKYTVIDIDTHRGVKEARLKEINSWVAVSYLTLV